MRLLCQKRSSSAPAFLRVSPKKLAKRKGWHLESMQAAIKAVKEGQTVSQAARDHGVHKTALFDL